MARSVNTVILMGHLGRDAETKVTGSGTSRSTFTLATNRRTKGQDGTYAEVTDWHNIVVWRSEKIADYLVKGTKVHVNGRLENRSWEANDGGKRYMTEVVLDADGLVLVGGGGPGAAPLRSEPKAAAPKDPMEISDDDVPF